MPRRPPAVARVLTQATATMRAHRMVEPGELVLVAVSGGPDSVCLLYTLHGLRRLFRMRIAVFHFDHRLRGDSAADAAYVTQVFAGGAARCRHVTAPVLASAEAAIGLA